MVMIDDVIAKLRRDRPGYMYIITDDMDRFVAYDDKKKVADGGMEIISLAKNEGKPCIVCMKDKKEDLYFCIQFTAEGKEIEGSDFAIRV